MVNGLKPCHSDISQKQSVKLLGLLAITWWTWLDVTRLFLEWVSTTTSPSKLRRWTITLPGSLSCQSNSTCPRTLTPWSPTAPCPIDCENTMLHTEQNLSCNLCCGLPDGQLWLLQSCLSVFDPLQLCPPLEGAGLVHDLILIWVPPPQVSLQLVHDDHNAQEPSTKSSSVSVVVGLNTEHTRTGKDRRMDRRVDRPTDRWMDKIDWRLRQTGRKYKKNTNSSVPGGQSPSLQLL